MALGLGKEIPAPDHYAKVCFRVQACHIYIYMYMPQSRADKHTKLYQSSRPLQHEPRNVFPNTTLDLGLRAGKTHGPSPLYTPHRRKMGGSCLEMTSPADGEQASIAPCIRRKLHRVDSKSQKPHGTYKHNPPKKYKKPKISSLTEEAQGQRSLR